MEGVKKTPLSCGHVRKPHNDPTFTGNDTFMVFCGLDANSRAFRSVLKNSTYIFLRPFLSFF